jgi:hypothetical protein
MLGAVAECGDAECTVCEEQLAVGSVKVGRREETGAVELLRENGTTTLL